MKARARRIRAEPGEDEARVAALTHALAETKPAYSARRVFTIPQLLTLYLLVSAALAALAFAPEPTATILVGALTLFSLASFLFKTVLFALGPAPREAAPLPGGTALPLYSILVPLYREAAALPDLLAALARLDYPKDRLDVKLILEADDEETAEALARLRLDPRIEIIRVPPFRPRTKPNDCVPFPASL